LSTDEPHFTMTEDLDNQRRASPAMFLNSALLGDGVLSSFSPYIMYKKTRQNAISVSPIKTSMTIVKYSSMPMVPFDPQLF